VTGRVIYFAGPLFTDAERAWNLEAARVLRAGLPEATLLLPQELCAAFDAVPGSAPDFARIFATCLEHLLRADVVVAVLDGADADSGTSWEAGHAYARGVPVVGVRTDWRPAEDGSANCMLSRSCVSIVRALPELPAAVRAALSG
jgi:nucleoside 2-deoxyribosyltransferase